MAQDQDQDLGLGLDQDLEQGYAIENGGKSKRRTEAIHIQKKSNSHSQHSTGVANESDIQRQSLVHQQQQFIAAAAAAAGVGVHAHSMPNHFAINQSLLKNATIQQMPLQHQIQMSHAEKRANHNAIERARRENLNVRFLELAQTIPALLHVRKPSKSVIVSRAIEYLHETKERLEVKTRSLQLLRQQNEEFKQDINRLRSKLGMNAVVFPDNVDQDLVFEANLEHAKEHAADHPQMMQQQHQQQQQARPHPIQTAGFGSFGSASPYSASFSRTGSPFETGIMSPLQEDQMDALEIESVSHSMPVTTMHLPININGMNHHQSILGSALQDMKMPLHMQQQQSFGSYQQQSHQNTSSYPISMSTAGSTQPLSLQISGGGVGDPTNSFSNSFPNSYSQQMDMTMGQHMGYHQQAGSWNDVQQRERMMLLMQQQQKL